MTVELPRWPLADRLALALCVAAGIALETVLARHPGAPAGIGAVMTCVLATWQWQQRRRRPSALEFGHAADRLRLADGRYVPFAVGPGSRVLAASVVLHWQAPGCSSVLWLTPADLPRHVLRSLAVRLVAGGRPGGQ